MRYWDLSLLRSPGWTSNEYEKQERSQQRLLRNGDYDFKLHRALVPQLEAK